MTLANLATPSTATGYHWQPDAATAKQTALWSFIEKSLPALGTKGYADFWRWSCASPEQFWSALWDDSGVIGDKGARAFVAVTVSRPAVLSRC